MEIQFPLAKTYTTLHFKVPYPFFPTYRLLPTPLAPSAAHITSNTAHEPPHSLTLKATQNTYRRNLSPTFNLILAWYHMVPFLIRVRVQKLSFILLYFSSTSSDDIDMLGHSPIIWPLRVCLRGRIFTRKIFKVRFGSQSERLLGLKGCP